MSLETKELNELESGALELGVKWDPRMAEPFSKFTQILHEANTRLNLTSIHRKGYVALHFLDSLAAFRLINSYKPQAILDIGTGGGFPGIPLAIVMPDVNFTLIDGTEKKIFFVTDVVRSLGLSNVTTIHSRSESLASDPAHVGKYDVVVTRAVATLSVVGSYMLPFMKPDGGAIAYKGEAVDSELVGLEDIQKLGGEIKGIKRIKLPNTSLERAFVVIERTKS